MVAEVNNRILVFDDNPEIHRDFEKVSGGSAHSDYSWDDIVKRLGKTDQLLILIKPIDPQAVIHQIQQALGEDS